MKNLEEVKKEVLRKRFGSTAIGILISASSGPVNPYDYFFGKTLRRSWAYGYFERLAAYGFLVPVDAPTGRRGKWYSLA